VVASLDGGRHDAPFDRIVRCGSGYVAAEVLRALAAAGVSLYCVRSVQDVLRLWRRSAASAVDVQSAGCSATGATSARATPQCGRTPAARRESSGPISSSVRSAAALPRQSCANPRRSSCGPPMLFRPTRRASPGRLRGRMFGGEACARFAAGRGLPRRGLHLPKRRRLRRRVLPTGLRRWQFPGPPFCGVDTWGFPPAATPRGRRRGRSDLICQTLRASRHGAEDRPGQALSPSPCPSLKLPSLCRRHRAGPGLRRSPMTGGNA
jgi:hypothetical protein